MSFKGIWVVIFLFFVWAGGFLWFVFDMPDNPPCPECTTDAIVVLTGGNSRIAAALDLLDQKLSDHLLISGVNPGTTLKTIEKSSGFKGNIAHYKISLDNQSRSTKENALYTLKWLQKNGYQSIRLVTANYHIRRSLLEFQTVMPDLFIVAHPITPHETFGLHWYNDYRIFCLFLNEYNKYLGTLLRLDVKKLMSYMR